jgi:hypothetical protein
MIMDPATNEMQSFHQELGERRPTELLRTATTMGPAPAESLSGLLQILREKVLKSRSSLDLQEKDEEMVIQAEFEICSLFPPSPGSDEVSDSAIKVIAIMSDVLMFCEQFSDKMHDSALNHPLSRLQATFNAVD